MICFEVHKEENGCMQDIPSGSRWKFCPKCGRPTGHAVIQEEPFVVMSGQEERRLLRIKNNGNESAVGVTIRLDQGLPGLEIISKKRLIIQPGLAESVEISLPALDRANYNLGCLILESDDAALSNPDLDPWEVWQERKKREQRSWLSAEISTPASLRPLQEIAIFTEATSERTIILINDGDAPVDVVHIRTPIGYKLTQGQSGRIIAKSRREFTLSRDWSKSNVPLYSIFECVTSGGTSATVQLRSTPPGEPQEESFAVVGIDFGTAFTSVSFRHRENHPEIDDTVRFLKPSTEDDFRFPTRLWIGNDNTFRFSSAATARYIQDANAGLLFREIKTLLREVNPNFIFTVLNEPEQAKTFREDALHQMNGRFGDNWPEVIVSKYLHWLLEETILPEVEARYGTRQVTIQYVFSIPVLDFATPGQDVFREQKQRMLNCIEAAGYPKNHVDIQFEPVCVALGLLYSTDESQSPRLGSKNYPIKDSDYIAVFDSGGGTTDVVLARAVQGEGGKIQLEIENCLGVDHQQQTFGGELVTDELIRAVKLERTIEGDWYSGTLNLGTLLQDPKGRLERDNAEVLKTELAASPSGEVTRTSKSGEVTTIDADVLYKITEPYVISLAQELKESVFSQVSREQTRYYLYVGGNSYLPPVSEWVELFMQDHDPERNKRRLMVPEENRKLAICYGAAWVPDARIRNAVPYDMQLMAGSDCILTVERNSSEELYGKAVRYTLPSRRSLDFHLIINLDHESFQVAEYSYHNPYNATMELNLWLDLQNGTLKLDGMLRDVSGANATIERNRLLAYNL